MFKFNTQHFALSTQHSVTAKEALREAVMTLQRAHIESASLDARILLEHALNISHEKLLFSMDAPMEQAQLRHYHLLVAKRAKRQPIAQLTGKREFWGLDFKVTEATLDPRPDSETLIEAILERFPDRAAPLSILDLGVGTGCLMLSLLHEFPRARATGVDACEQALAVAKENALSLGLKSRAGFVTSHWCENVEGAFDVIIANPPYIPTATIATLAPEVAEYEPRRALDGGADGLDCYRAIMPQVKERLAPNGIAVFEIGIGQMRDIETIAAGCGLPVASRKNDLSGITRCIVVKGSEC